MAKCIQCGSKIKDDANYCPVCGLRNPLDKKINDDVTIALDDINSKVPLIESKSKVKACVLAMCLGFTGAHYRYLGKKKMALVSIVVSIILFILSALLTYLLIDKDIIISLLIGVLVIYLFNIIDGVTFLFMHRKDSDGVNLK